MLAPGTRSSQELSLYSFVSHACTWGSTVTLVTSHKLMFLCAHCARQQLAADCAADGRAGDHGADGVDTGHRALAAAGGAAVPGAAVGRGAPDQARVRVRAGHAVPQVRGHR